MMLGGAHVASASALDLRDHLTTAFGVSALWLAADVATKVARAAIKQREGIRKTAKTTLADRAAKERELEEINRDIDNHRLQRESLSKALETSNTLTSVLQEWSSYWAAAARRRAAFSDLLVTVKELLPEVASESEISNALNEESCRLRQELKDASNQLALAHAQILSSTSALSLLGAEYPSCPTCLRPFQGREVQVAIEEQESIRLEAEEVQAQHERVLGDIEEGLMRLDKLRQSLMQLPEEPIAPATPVPDADPTQQSETALAALQEHDKEAGRIEQRHDGVAQALKEDDQIRRAKEEQVAAYRYEAMAVATATALERTAEAVTEEYLEPLAVKVRERWKVLFGSGGLQLRPSGRLVRVVGDRELPWETLSGGERIWARLVTHLLVISASTKLTFAWFDEPLEHLDPTARRAVATALATATHPGSPTQLIVTTYEHAIARQLAADIPETSIKYLRRSV
jgi:DNA repair exonuclease SbcCD ATPase subunit